MNGEELGKAAFLEAWYQDDAKHGAPADGDRANWLFRAVRFGFEMGCGLASVLVEAHALEGPEFARLERAAFSHRLPSAEDYVRTGRGEMLTIVGLHVVAVLEDELGVCLVTRQYTRDSIEFVELDGRWEVRLENVRLVWGVDEAEGEAA